MAPTRRSRHPVAALDWMVGAERATVLDLAHGSAAFARELGERGHRVSLLDRDLGRARTLARSEELAGSTAAIALVPVLGQPENLPFRSGQFDAVTAADSLQHFAPGLALPEVARVLRPGGTFSVVHTTRDDTVPWVRRLARTVQEVDPQAMRGDYGQQAVEAVAESEAFTDLERRDFRNWVPITREGLLEMVSRRPAVQSADASRREALLAEVGELFDAMARPPEPLLLPFQSSCWRAHPVTGRGPTAPDDDVLQFNL